jgi:hypothetical protein
MQTGFFRGLIFSRLLVASIIGIGIVLVGCSSSDDSASAEVRKVQNAGLLKQIEKETEKPIKGTKPPRSIKGKLASKGSTPDES